VVGLPVSLSWNPTDQRPGLSAGLFSRRSLRSLAKRESGEVSMVEMSL
jgi:hypothetical protein